MNPTKPTNDDKLNPTGGRVPSRNPAVDDDDESAEDIRHGSQTAQDREHTVRGGDNVTAPTKEFPT